MNRRLDRDAKVTSKPISELCSIIWLVTFISIPFLLSTTFAPLLRSVEQERKRSKLRLRYNVQWSCVLARNFDLTFSLLSRGQEKEKKKDKGRGSPSAVSKLSFLSLPYLYLSLDTWLMRLTPRPTGR